MVRPRPIVVTSVSSLHHENWFIRYACHVHYTEPASHLSSITRALRIRENASRWMAWACLLLLMMYIFYFPEGWHFLKTSNDDVFIVEKEWIGVILGSTKRLNVSWMPSISKNLCFRKNYFSWNYDKVLRFYSWFSLHLIKVK